MASCVLWVPICASRLSENRNKCVLCAPTPPTHFHPSIHEPAKTLASVWKASRTRWAYRIYTHCLAPRTSHQDGARKRPFSPGNIGTHKTLRFASLAAPIRSSITPHHSLFKTTITRAASRPPALVTVSARMMHDALCRARNSQKGKGGATLWVG